MAPFWNQVNALFRKNLVYHVSSTILINHQFYSVSVSIFFVWLLFFILNFAEAACEVTLEGDFVSGTSVYTARGFAKLRQQDEKNGTRPLI